MDLFRCWTSPEVTILGLTKRSAALGDGKVSPRAGLKMVPELNTGVHAVMACM